MRKGERAMPSGSKTIWIVNQYASALEVRSMELAAGFAAQGHRVVIVTSSFHHGMHDYLYKAPVTVVHKAPGVDAVYLRARPGYQGNGAARVLNMAHFAYMFLRRQKELLAVAGRPDAVIASSPSPFVWELGLYAKRRYRAKAVAEVRDLWPLSLLDIQGVSALHPFVVFIGMLEKRAYRRSDAVVTTMPRAYEYITKTAKIPRGKVHWMPNGIHFDKVQQALREPCTLPRDLARCLDENWCCVYTGSLVKSECIDQIMQAFNGLGEKDVHLLIIGRGHERENLLRVAERLGDPRIHFFDAVESRQVPHVLSKAKVCLAALKNRRLYEYGISLNKLNDYLAVGTPTVLMFSGESAVSQAGHISLAYEDFDGMARAIARIRHMDQSEIDGMKRRAQAVIRADFDYPRIARNYLKLLESL